VNEGAPGMERFGRMKDDKNKDMDSVAADFIMRTHRAWALQKSTTKHPAS
jgi:hypothetical protein